MVFAKRLRNDLELIVTALRGCPGDIRAVAVESTYNWYWLVDGLRSAGFDVRLANTAAVKQYDGLKHGDDFSDAKHLAQLLRLGILPQGYICPKRALLNGPAATAYPTPLSDRAHGPLGAGGRQ
jgi:hypothetical protein